MFTGIIKEIGEITKFKEQENGTVFTVECYKILKNKKIGDSIAVNGVCVTIVEIEKTMFSFSAMTETLNKTNLKYFKAGQKVNLEPAILANQTLDGHIVQGHVDCEGIITKIGKKGKDTNIEVAHQKNIKKYIAKKGSITVNGVSLTVSGITEKGFVISLIPHTLSETNLGTLRTGDKVNLEIDVIARYLENMIKKNR